MAGVTVGAAADPLDPLDPLDDEDEEDPRTVGM
jgi:hypothetical protein